MLTIKQFKNRFFKHHIIKTAKLSKSHPSLTPSEKLALLDSMVGVIPDNGTTLEEVRYERLQKQ